MDFDGDMVEALRAREVMGATATDAGTGVGVGGAGADAAIGVGGGGAAAGRTGGTASAGVNASVFGQRELGAFSSFEQAYYRLMMDIMEQQVASTQLVLDGTEVKRIFVDGGFGKNQVYMHLLAAAFPEIEVFAASVPQATAMGAALAIHAHWNSRFLPGDIIELKFYK